MPSFVQRGKTMENFDVRNAMLPMDMIDQSAKTRDFLSIMTDGHECVPCEGSFGIDEGDAFLAYYDKGDGLGYCINYEWEECGYGLCRITSYEIDRCEEWDGYFDVTRETLETYLKKLAKAESHDKRTIDAIASYFAINL